jgi:hypothetical protein
MLTLSTDILNKVSLENNREMQWAISLSGAARLEDKLVLELGSPQHWGKMSTPLLKHTLIDAITVQRAVLSEALTNNLTLPSTNQWQLCFYLHDWLSCEARTKSSTTFTTSSHSSTTEAWKATIKITTHFSKQKAEPSRSAANRNSPIAWAATRIQPSFPIGLTRS